MRSFHPSIKEHHKISAILYFHLLILSASRNEAMEILLTFHPDFFTGIRSSEGYRAQCKKLLWVVLYITCTCSKKILFLYYSLLINHLRLGRCQVLSFNEKMRIK